MHYLDSDSMRCRCLLVELSWHNPSIILFFKYTQLIGVQLNINCTIILSHCDHPHHTALLECKAITENYLMGVVNRLVPNLFKDINTIQYNTIQLAFITHL